MAKDQSVAPQERVNITYKPASGDRQSEVELPLKLLFVGDYTGRADDRPVEDRKPVNIDKDNFQQVLAEHKLAVSMNVENTLADAPGGELSVELKFQKLSDFHPDSVARQIAPVRELIDLRDALTALKGPMGNIPAFRKKIEGILKDPATRERLLAELGVAKEEG